MHNSQHSHSIETVFETDDRTRLGIRGLTRRQRGQKKRRKEAERGERERERESARKEEEERERKRESMGISTKHVTIKGAGGCESSLD